MTAEPTVPSGMATVDALALLPIPARLSDAQRAGHVCVWGGETLVAETAVNLGSRKLDGAIAFLQACRNCVSRAAMTVMFQHSTGTNACTKCQKDPYCETGRALARVIKLGQR
jgi:hypothetical protein